MAVTRLLLERGASLAACDASGRNALELAISAGKRLVKEIILHSFTVVFSYYVLNVFFFFFFFLESLLLIIQ